MEMYSHSKMSIDLTATPPVTGFQSLSPTANSEVFNNSNGSSLLPKQCVHDTRISQVVFPVLYTIVFFLGLLLNGFSIWIFYRVPSHFAFIVYLKSTMAADFLMIFMLPFKILTDSGIGSWQMRAFVCRFSSVVFYTSMYINLILLGLIELTRFLQITLECKWVDNVRNAKAISIASWLLMFGISIPNMILSNEKATPLNVKKCASLKSKLGMKWDEAVNHFCQFIFWTTFTIVVILYTSFFKKVYDLNTQLRSKDSSTTKRIKAKVFFIVAVFFLCFAPFHFARVPYSITQMGDIKDCSVQNKLYIVKEITLWLAATNVCMYPLICIVLFRPFHKRRTNGSRFTSMKAQDSRV